MRDYGKVAPQFWTGQTGKALKAQGMEAVIVAMYLMTSPHANMIGLYYLPKIYIAHETGLGMEGACKGLARAIEAGFCTYDEASEHVFVHAMARFQIAETLKPDDKRCKGIENELAKAPKGMLCLAFRDMYGASFHLKKESPLEAPSKPLPSQEQEQEQEQEQKDQPLSSSADADDPPAEFGSHDLQTRLATVAAEAIATFNASPLVKAHGGVLASVSAKVGKEKRKGQVRRCLRTARQICDEAYGSPMVTARFWADYWAEVAADPFHSGRQGGGKGHENWVPDFEFLTKEVTMLRVYDRTVSEAAA
jgi:hypothetical protein